MGNWFQPLLPASYFTVRRAPKLEEDELALWFQDACEPSNGFQNASDCTQRKGADNRINTIIFQRDALTWQADKFNIQLCFELLSFCKPNHPQVGFQCIKLIHSCGIVMDEIRAGTYPDLKDDPLSKRDDLLANFFDGGRITE